MTFSCDPVEFLTTKACINFAVRDLALALLLFWTRGWQGWPRIIISLDDIEGWPSSVSLLAKLNSFLKDAHKCMKLGLEKGLPLSLLFFKIEGTDDLFLCRLFRLDQAFKFVLAVGFWVACFVLELICLVVWEDFFPAKLVVIIVDCDMLDGNRVAMVLHLYPWRRVTHVHQASLAGLSTWC